MTCLSFSQSQGSICLLDALLLLIAFASHVAQMSIWMSGMKKINACYIKYVIKVSCSYYRTFQSELVKHEDGKVYLGKLLCSGAQHWRLSLEESLAEREIPRQQRSCAMQSTMTAVSVLLIVVIFTGAIHPCELILEVVLLPSTLCIHFP